MTPHEQFEQWRNRRRKARTITNLHLDEVSSVDRGAGRGVKVVMLKRDTEVEQETEMSVIEKANRVLADVEDPNMIAKHIERLAEESGMTLSEFHATPHGQRLLQKSVVWHRGTLEWDSAVGDGYEVAKNEMSGERGTAPGARRHNADNRATTAQQTHNPAPQGASEGSANKACERFKALAESYAAVHGVDMDKAYTAIACSELGKTLLKQDAAQHGVYR